MSCIIVYLVVLSFPERFVFMETKQSWPLLAFAGELQASLFPELSPGLLEISQIFDKCMETEHF